MAYKILKRVVWYVGPTPKEIVWSPGYQGLKGNEVANSAARALTHRAPHPGSSDSEIRKPLPRFREILNYYCENRRLFPVPAKGLSKADEPILRRLQTNTFMFPAVAKHFHPKTDGQCPHCEEVCDTFHMVWAYQKNPALSPNPSPTREAWEAALLNCSGLESQRALAQRARAAASTSGVQE